MSEPSYLAQARADLAGRCAEPIEQVLLVHPSGRRKMVFGRKDLSSRLGINNYLVLTTTHVRLYSLGGRTGLKMKDELGAWPRTEVRASSDAAERSSFMASTGSSLNWRVICVHLEGPGLDLKVDVRGDAGLFIGDEDFLDQENPEGEVQEVIDDLKAEAEFTAASVAAFVGALAAD